jgi:hypothetical protein
MLCVGNDPTNAHDPSGWKCERGEDGNLTCTVEMADKQPMLAGSQPRFRRIPVDVTGTIGATPVGGMEIAVERWHSAIPSNFLPVGRTWNAPG